MKSFFDRLDGYKTYIVVLVALIVMVCNSLGYIDEAVSNSLLMYMGLAGLAALRHGIDK